MSETTNKSKVQNFTEDIKLHEAEKPWKPSFKLKRSSEAGCGISEKKLKRNALSILNKITPEKFELLLKQLEKLDINNEQASNVLICLIYDKAVREPIYNVTYVKMCKFLSPIKISTTNFQAADFHSLFMQKCLKEFENALQEQSKFKDILNSLEKSHDQVKLKQNMWEEQYKTKCRLLGNVKLLGELFNQDMIDQSVVQNCLKALCCDQNEVLLEALCLMLKTAGKKLFEEDRNTVHTSEMENIFQKMQHMVDMHLTSTRIRFMLRDVIDLKENNWISRRKEMIPKTIKEIHREALFEESDHEHVQNNKIVHNSQNYADQVETRSKHLIEEFLENNNFEPICHYVNSLLPNRVVAFVKSSICQVLEDSPQNRDSVGELLFQLVKKKFVKIDHFKDGFSGVVEKCKNIALDTPLIWNNLGQIIYPLINSDSNRLNFFKVVLESHVSSNIAEKVLSGIFHCIASKEGSHKAKILWDEIKEVVNEVIKNDFNIEDVISVSNLHDEGDVQNQLFKFLQNSEETDIICHWIDVNHPDTTDPNFVHALVLASIKNATIVSADEYGLDEKKFENSLPLLSIYVGGKKNLELQALRSLQLYVQDLKVSIGLLKETFEILHKSKVIDNESFKEWEADVDSSEILGQKTALESVKSFLSQLKIQDP